MPLIKNGLVTRLAAYKAMKIKPSFRFQVLCAAMIAGCAGPEARVIKIADKIHTIAAKREINKKEMTAAAGHFKKEHFSEKQLKDYSDKTLSALSEVSGTLAFYSPEQELYLTRQEKTFNEKVRRNNQVADDVESMAWSYIAARMFDKARKIRQQFPSASIPFIPPTITVDTGSSAARWPVYDIFEDGEKIELKELHLENGPKIVVSMFTCCSAAERAMAKILADPGLAPAFRKHGVLLTDRFDVKGILMWREHFNFPNVYIAYKASRLQDFDFNISPYFYFLKDGKVLSRAEGWGKNSQQEILKGLEAITISTSPNMRQ